jgi:transposase InsO family protein
MRDAELAARMNALWVTDITFLPTLAGFLYLALVLDAWSRRIVGWAFSSDLKTRVVRSRHGARGPKARQFEQAFD